jgi:L-serine dehydratase
MIFFLHDEQNNTVLSETYFSIGGGFICTLAEIDQLNAPLKMESGKTCPYPFDSARSMLMMSQQSGLSIAAMKRANELTRMPAQALDQGLDDIWQAMRRCVESGLSTAGQLPGGLKIQRRARTLYEQLQARPEQATLNDWLMCLCHGRQRRKRRRRAW